VRHLFDWLVTGHIVPVNPAASVRGPAHSQRRGKTPVLAPDEARLLDSIDVTTHAGLRDRALIGLMVYSSRGSARRWRCGSRTCSCRTPPMGPSARKGRQAP
jgi:site-specific recombinase XerC